MKNILVVSGHPDLSRSLANSIILNDLAAALPDAEIRRLDSLYPTGQIDIAAEQSAVSRADIIVWQFPFSWYSLPALLKKWLDEVMIHGFAHGSQAKLDGKKLIVSFTAGAPAEAYGKDRPIPYGIEDFLPQFECTARLCRLDYQPPVYTAGINFLLRDDAEGIVRQTELAHEHARRLIARLQKI